MLQWLSKNYILKTTLLLGAMLGVVFLFAHSVNAQSIANPSSTLNQGLQTIQQPLGLPAFDIRLIIANIIRWLLGLVGLVLVVLIMYAGYLWMTAGGNEEQITQAKGVMRNAVIGLAIILSAYSIVAFVMSMLGISGGMLDSNGEITAPEQVNLSGSGALGKTVKEHYPTRDQQGVPRNTKIVITFFKPVSTTSFIVDTNDNEIFGDCVSTTDSNFNWNTHCDHVKTDGAGGVGGNLTDDIINVKRTDTGVSVAGLVALTSAGEGGLVKTIVLKPITNVNENTGGYLGSNTEDVGYTVYFGPDILTDDKTNNYPPLFNNINPDLNHYNWNFTCGTLLDITPPHIVNVYPNSSNSSTKNTAIQVSFSEPISPIGLQGSMNSTTSKNYFFLNSDNNKNNLFLQNDNALLPAGTWNLVNNFQTLEFTPGEVCGKNACGDPIYCLPVCPTASSTCESANYRILFKTASTTGTGFSDVPFSGVDDLAGNALDGNNNNLRETPTTTLPVFNNWLEPDNYNWSFLVTDNMDTSSPYLVHIEPGIDASDVPPNSPWKMVFSKRMRTDPLYNIQIVEYPASANGVSLWKNPSLSIADYQTVTMNHGPFLKTINKMYLPMMTSTIIDVNGNCFYPGKGPNTQAADGSVTSLDCVDAGTCCAVTDATNNSFCCDGTPSDSANGVNNCQTNITNTYVVQP